MIEKVICEIGSDINYEKLSEERKQKYQEIYTRIQCYPEKYIISVDVASPGSKDWSAVIKLNYEEFLKGNKVIESVDYF